MLIVIWTNKQDTQKKNRFMRTSWKIFNIIMYFVLFFGKGNSQQSFLYIFTWFSKRHRCKHKQLFREVLFFSSVNIYLIFIFLEDNNPRFINCNNKSFRIPHFPGAAYKCEAYKNEVNKIIKSMILSSYIPLSFPHSLSHTFSSHSISPIDFCCNFFLFANSPNSSYKDFIIYFENRLFISQMRF